MYKQNVLMLKKNNVKQIINDVKKIEYIYIY